MSLEALWQGLEASPLGDFIASSSWAFPTIESVHVIAIVTVVGTVGMMDLRLLGRAFTDRKVTEVEHDTLRWTWVAFAVAVVTGTLLFISKASVYARDPWFQFKLVWMALAGVNMLAFHFGPAWRGVAGWDAARDAPKAAKIAAVLSLSLWVLVVMFGREIGFTLGQYE
jgi:hypothetical protein